MRGSKRDYAKMEELYTLYEQRVYHVAYAVLHNVQQAEDAVQETFLTLYQRLKELRKLDEEELKRYILRIAKNKAIDSYRKNRRHGEFLNEYQRETKDAVDENVEEWERSFLSEVQIDELLTNLTDSNRRVFKYKIFYNLSYTEIADLMGIAETNVRKQFERARKKVVQFMRGGQINGCKELKPNG
ncbi:RNA polymerase sigma factor [Fictibacillus macauensis ZFHKF-1]|uniref:RNA polymerase sigma factor n=1 Tax=Fictibacillus macauensis ZFHKF-1 TaxID=1196324 RepID=I8UBC6_9BACL|nr:RNA polymerase sigma factor [Fictibacillus macauensis]EIT84245.1 RNA polymerase sigma factor [Fictibacillus macauensis ZFHKF-1]